MTTQSMRVVRIVSMLCLLAPLSSCGRKGGASSSSSSVSSSGAATQESTTTSGSSMNSASGAGTGAAAGAAAGAKPSAARVNPHPGLASSEWQVDEIEGQAVVTQSHASLSFGTGGKVAGNTGCNQFSGSARLAGSSVHFSPMASTRKACQPELMSQETRMMKALGGVTGYLVDTTGVLHLNGADGTTLMKLTRATQ